jgi:uncharacterized protein (DUF1800 family)
MQHMRSLQGLLAAVMCLSLLVPGVPGASEPASSAAPDSSRPSYSTFALQGDERILHALNRFTFGPRPGDLAAVRVVGLDRWFEQQLRPATIDDTALQIRLAQYPAMQWSSEDLLYRLPSNSIIRQVIDGKAPMPPDGALHTVYANQVARVTFKRQEKEAKNQPAVANMAGSPAMATNNTMTMAPNMAASPTADAPPPIDPKLVPAVLALQPQQRVARLTAMPQTQFDSVFESLKGPDRTALLANLSPAQRETVSALENPDRTVVDELMAQRLTRDIYSNAQLQQVMTDFWLNHFNVYLRKNEATPYYLVSYERDVIRPRALGKFEDLLEATAHSPAMLQYLDNASSTGPDSPAAQKAKLAAARQPANKHKAPEGLNENYARELMELQTVGVNGGYTQADVIQAARILTGWTVDRPQRGGGFKFDPNRHEPGDKKVLGKKFKDGGEREGRDLLHMLATRPATAQFISRKLAIRFVSDDPPKPLVDRMAKSYMSSGGDISAVLKTMFKSPEFWQPALYRAKVKTPIEFVVSAARASNVDLANMQPITNALREMGMPLYGAIPPTGYKWEASDWVSTGALVNRMNFALSLAANRLPGIAATWSTAAIYATTLDVPQPPAAPVPGISGPASGSRNGQAQPVTPTTEESRLESLLVSGGVSDSTRTAILQQFQAQTGQSPSAVMPVSLRTNSPGHPPAADAAKAANAIEKQDQVLAGLLLGSPEFQRR